MAAIRKETLLIKHAVGGRTFIDTAKTPISYKAETVHAMNGQKGCKFVVDNVPDELGREILVWKEELNVFLFRDYENAPTRKLWFYVLNGPVEYDAANRRLSIMAQSSIEYVPDHFHP
ncbi:MAG: hypothetical protein K0R75_966 [Paenibacillaceae bacterium]|jgi:hypothetical protein|nr:hypothetical protein [Paenibacillaceae bacterium]